jgi:hypothetical protein
VLASLLVFIKKDMPIVIRGSPPDKLGSAGAIRIFNPLLILCAEIAFGNDRRIVVRRIE